MSGGYGTNEFARSLQIKSPFLAKIAQAVYPPMPTLNTIPTDTLNQIKNSVFVSGGVLLNIGSGAKTGSGRRLWTGEHCKRCKIIHLDIEIDFGVSVVADAHKLPIKSGSLESVVLQAVIEHVRDPKKVIDESFRVLKPGGFLYLEVPFMQGVHADPYDFQRFTLYGLLELTKEFDYVDKGVSVGPACSLVWFLRDVTSSIFQNRSLYLLVRFAVAWMTAPLRYLDLLFRRTGASEKLASEYFLLVRKPL